VNIGHRVSAAGGVVAPLRCANHGTFIEHGTLIEMAAMNGFTTKGVKITKVRLCCLSP
jgi:hypothetical protein